MFLTSSPALWYVQCLANGVYRQLSGRPAWCSQLLLLSPRDDVVSKCAISSTVTAPAAFLRRHRFRYCRQNHTTSATQFTDATTHCTYISKTLYVVRAGVVLWAVALMSWWESFSTAARNSTTIAIVTSIPARNVANMYVEVNPKVGIH
jgi:hypothetical protein